MEAPFLALLETARRVGRVAEECKLTVDVDEFVSSFRPDLMDVMAAWYRGAKFADVMKMTDVFEVRSTGQCHGIPQTFCVPTLTVSSHIAVCCHLVIRANQYAAR